MEGITGHTTGHQGHRTTDEYGNPINQGGGIGDFSTNGTGTGVTTGYGKGTTGAHASPLGGGGGYGHDQQEHHGGVTGMLHRTDSSSSSEDDGLGGRRKKGITEKIKEKLPGGGHRSDQMTSTTTPGAYVYDGNQQGHVHEKKGMTEKIKDKLPGHNA